MWNAAYSAQLLLHPFESIGGHLAYSAELLLHPIGSFRSQLLLNLSIPGGPFQQRDSIANRAHYEQNYYCDPHPNPVDIDEVGVDKKDSIAQRVFSEVHRNTVFAIKGIPDDGKEVYFLPVPGFVEKSS
jgi:hypothetical protein